MECTFSHVSFRDFDLFCEWARGSGWNTRSDQLSYGPCEIDYDHFVFPGLTVAHHRSKQSQRDVFTIPDGNAVFVIPRAKLPVIWSGRELSPSVLGILRSGHEHSVTLPAGWDGYEFTVAEDLITASEIFPPDFFKRTARLKDAHLPLLEPETGRFVERLDRFFDLARTADGALPGDFDGVKLYDFVICGLRSLFDAGLAVAGSTTPRQLRQVDLVTRARESMTANLRRSLTAEEIASSVGVSYRTLHYAFRESLGVSPYRYFLTQRLHAVRRQLQSLDLTVAEASTRYGFYSPSRFARQYRRLFGELPSETCATRVDG